MPLLLQRGILFETSNFIEIQKVLRLKTSKDGWSVPEMPDGFAPIGCCSLETLRELIRVMRPTLVDLQFLPFL